MNKPEPMTDDDVMRICSKVYKDFATGPRFGKKDAVVECSVDAARAAAAARDAQWEQMLAGQEPVAWIDRHELSVLSDDTSPTVGPRKLSEYDVPLHAAPKPVQEQAWLIEFQIDQKAQPEWFVGGPINSAEFHKDANRAMRFSRKQDAQAMLDWLRINEMLIVSGTNVARFYKVTEHMWCEPLCAAPQPVQETDTQHPDDVAVGKFSTAMKVKMAKQRAKGYGGWDDPEQCPAERLQKMLVDHIAKGDYVDVGNFAMMLWNRGEATAAPQPAEDEKK